MTLEDYVKMQNKEDNEHKNIRYPEDVKKIVAIMKKRDIEITPEEAQYIWDTYSDDYCAQWLFLPEDDEDIFNIIIKYARKVYIEA